jgi:hypothetical protein
LIIDVPRGADASRYLVTTDELASMLKNFMHIGQVATLAKPDRPTHGDDFPEAVDGVSLPR